MARTQPMTRTLPIPSGRPVWRRAPTSLLRSPALWAALALSAFLVSVTVASYPLFLSASKSQLLADRIADPLVSRYGAGITYRSTRVPFTDRAPGDDPGTLADRRGEEFRRRAAESLSLDPTQEQILGPVMDISLPGGRDPASGPIQGRLFAGTDVLDNVTVLDGTDGPGVWIPDVVARSARLHPGDTLELGVEGRSETLTVDGSYRTISALPRSGYWRTWVDDIYPICLDIDCPLPPQPILVDRDQLLDLGTRLGREEATFAWVAAVRSDPPLTLDEARVLTRFSERFEADISERGTDLFRLFHCCGEMYLRRTCVQFFCGSSEITFTSLTPGLVDKVDERLAAVQGPLLVSLIAGLGISMAIVAAAAVFALSSRRVEATVLSARGWGGTAIGTKSILEAAIPFLAGTLVGFLVAMGAIAALGPPGRIEGSARTAAVAWTAAAMLGALALVGVVSGAVFLSNYDHRHRFTRLVGFVPLELAAFAAAWIMARRLGAVGATEDSGGIQRPGSAVFLFPLLLALGVGIVAARIMAISLTASHHRSATSSAAGPWWIASRRLRTSGRLPQLLLIAGSLTLAVFVSSQAIVHSLRTTVEAKAKVFVGSDVQIVVSRDTEPAEGYAYPMTTVIRSRGTGSITGTDGRFDLLAVDPATLERAAYWNDALSDDELGELVARLPAPPGQPLPVVIANGGDADPGSIDLSGERVPIQVVGRATSFPGTSSASRPLLVVDRATLAERFAGLPDPLNNPMTSTELWIQGPPAAILSSLDRLGVFALSTLTAEEVEEIPFIDAAIQIFLMLDVLGIVAMALLVVVAVIYLQARQRSRVVATELSQRMGQARATMRRTLYLELGTVLAASLAVGTVVGTVAASLVVPRLDPLPTIPPGPLIVQPVVSVFVGAVAVVVATFVGAALADRSARRVELGEALRVAE